MKGKGMKNKLTLSEEAFARETLEGKKDEFEKMAFNILIIECNHRIAEAVSLRYGIKDGIQRSFKDVGKLIERGVILNKETGWREYRRVRYIKGSGVSLSRARSIVYDGLRCLRQNSKRLEPFLKKDPVRDQYLYSE